MLVTFSSSLNIDLAYAISKAKESFPDQNFSDINSLQDLEERLNSIEQTLFVETTFVSNVSVKDVQILTNEIHSSVNELNCPQPPMLFSQEDLDACLCCDPPEFPEPIEISSSELNDLLNIAKDDNQDEVNKVLACIDQAKNITNELAILTDQEGKIKETKINLEEFLYNYRIMESYYTKRVTTLEQLLGIFDPLITDKKNYQAQIDLLTPLDVAAKSDLDAAKKRLTNGGSYNVTTTVNGITTTVTVQETQTHIDQLQSVYDSIHNPLLDWETKLQNTLDKISFNENTISPLLDEINFETTDTFLQMKPEDQAIARMQWLQENLSNLFNGGSTAFGKVNQFSSKTILTQNPSATVLNQSYLLSIQHDLKDSANILSGKQKTYMNTSSDVSIISVNGTPSGILYDYLYNVWGNQDKFFTREERGLTSDSNLSASDLIGTGAEVFGSNFIQDNNKFKDFYTNFEKYHNQKIDLVKTTIIEPALSDIIKELENLALKEVEYLFAYSKAFEDLPADSTSVIDLMTSIRNSSNVYIEKANSLRADFIFVQNAHTQILAQIENKKAEYSLIPCAATIKQPAEATPPPAGSDPLGANTIQQISPDDPDPTKFCYWVNFSILATAVNLLPIPGNGGRRYWPVGLKIPTPDGIVNVPLPIIWIPLAVIASPFGLFVMFIAQCGICPSPVIFYIGPNGEKKFILSLRPGDDFGANASDSLLKGLKIPIKSLINSVKVPNFKPILNIDGKDNLLTDLKDKILKKVQKLGVPDITPITNKLTTHSIVSDKKKVLNEVIKNYLNKLTIPTIKIPKNAENVNPKPPGPMEMINQLIKLTKMDLPNIAIPPIDMIDLKEKINTLLNLKELQTEIGTIPGLNFNNAHELEIEAYFDKVKKNLKKAFAYVHKKINPKELGMFAGVLASGVVFFNPYKCKPGTKGIGVPPIDSASLAIIGEILIAFNIFVDGISKDKLKELTKNGAQIGPQIIMDIIIGILKSLPDFKIPNPSKLSIKDMLKDSMKSLTKMKLPSLPDVSHPSQIQIPIPGEALKSALEIGVEAVINTLPLKDIDLTKMSPLDLKQYLITIIEQSFKPIENVLDPIFQIIVVFKACKDKSFSEILGLKKLTLDHSSIPILTKEEINLAMDALKLLSVVAYPTVAVMPELYQNAHPLLKSDDLPPWKRLSLQNFLFVCFLDAFCQEGKKTCGLQENP